MNAIIVTGGKQYKVAEGDVVYIETVSYTHLESAVVCCADKLCAMREMASGLRLWLLRGLPGKVR